MKRKLFIGLFILMILFTNVSFASYENVTMTVVEEPVCSIKVGENSKFEKKLISKDLANKEVTLQLQVTNEETASKPAGELILVLDKSTSMVNNKIGDQTRRDVIFNAASTLITNLLKDNDNLKIGIVSFATVRSELAAEKEGTIEDASVVSTLSNDATALTNSIAAIEADGPRTDLDAGLTLASQQFSQESNNKYMIVLTDGIPNVRVAPKEPTYSEEVFTQTNANLKSIEQKGISLITMLTGITGRENDQPMVTVTPKTNGEIVQAVFGTPEAPTAGKFYYVTDTEAEKTITQDIYNSLMPVGKSLKDITVVDYFPAEIIQNFDFAYVSKATHGDISASVDTTNNSITWNIPELQSGETATVQYTLKLKRNYDSSIINKILNTNEKVDISYTDVNDQKHNETSDVSPKLKLTEPPAVLPKAGTVTFFILAAGVLGLLTYSSVKLYKNK